MNSPGLWIALAVNVGFGGLAFWRGAVSRSGFVGGVIVGTTILACGGWGPWALLTGFFVFGSLATRLGYARKAGQGLAQEDSGRRGSKHALANCGTAVGLSVAAAVFPAHAGIFGLGIAAAFATALSDTLGSEVGQLYGRTPFLPTTFRRVPAGTEGAISVEGTLAGVAGSLFLGAIGWFAGIYGVTGWLLVGLGAFVGTLVESYVGAIWGQDARIGNETMNFMNTVVGSGVAMGLALAGAPH
jgi:uncharacterized protein (TIGR00297 family)